MQIRQRVLNRTCCRVSNHIANSDCLSPITHVLLRIPQHPGTTIVTDSVTSDGLTSFIENKLGKDDSTRHIVLSKQNEGVVVISLGPIVRH